MVTKILKQEPLGRLKNLSQRISTLIILHYTVDHGLANLFCKESDSENFRLCKLVSEATTQLSVLHKSSHKQ